MTFLLCIAMVLGLQVAWPYWEAPENSIMTRWYLPSFVFGSYAAVSMEQARTHVSERVATIGGAFVMLMVLVLTPGVRNYLFGMQFDSWLMDKFVYLSALWAMLLVFVAEGRGAFRSILGHRMLVKLGAWSYSTYLIHWLIYVKCSEGHQNQVSWAIAAFVGAVASGAILNYLVESPIERFRYFLRSWIGGEMSRLPHL
jgi:peptidoglycan/LPS O-acetylase OafA/YrhL